MSNGAVTNSIRKNSRRICRFALDNYEISEMDFYPPEDKRIFNTYIHEAFEDEFENYCKDMFKLLDEWDIFE